jgi:hypothetical protein
MTGYRSVLFLFATFLGSHSATFAQISIAVESAKNERPSVTWEQSSLVTVILDGKSNGAALLGYGGGKIYVAVFRDPALPKSKPHILEFGVGADQQAAVCAVPARLEVEKLLCNPMSDALPGCRPSQNAQHIVVHGGKCDPIVIYWDHKTDGLAWWRL